MYFVTFDSLRPRYAFKQNYMVIVSSANEA